MGVRPRRLAVTALVGALVAVGCGRGTTTTSVTVTAPTLGAKGTSTTAASDLGFPEFATKNTTRVGGADSVAVAAGASRAVYTGVTRVNRPRAVVLADGRDWRIGLASALLMSSPIRAPLLYANGPDKLP